jgi:hypothetical protein
MSDLPRGSVLGKETASYLKPLFRWQLTGPGEAGSDIAPTVASSMTSVSKVVDSCSETRVIRARIGKQLYQHTNFFLRCAKIRKFVSSDRVTVTAMLSKKSRDLPSTRLKTQTTEVLKHDWRRRIKHSIRRTGRGEGGG